jgi:hypothetical protein
VARIFPDDALLSEMKVEAYVGTPLFGAHGHPVGIMAALYFDNPALAEMILNMFSTRTGRRSSASTPTKPCGRLRHACGP